MSQTRTETKTNLRLRLKYSPEFYKELAEKEAKRIEATLGNASVEEAREIRAQAFLKFSQENSRDAIMEDDDKAASWWDWSESYLPFASTTAEMTSLYLQNQLEKTIYNAMWNSLVGSVNTDAGDATRGSNYYGNQNDYTQQGKKIDPILTNRDINRLGLLINTFLPEQKSLEPADVNIGHAMQLNAIKVNLEQQKLKSLLDRGAMYNKMRMDATHEHHAQYSLSKFGPELKPNNTVYETGLVGFGGLNGM
jgi:hypothetical protein